jgi:long-chain acyl-CoA synthetase
VGPLFHIGGMTAILAGPMGGAKLVLMHKWDLEEALRLAREEQVTQFGGVPTMVRQLLDRPGIDELELSVQGFPMGGAAVPPDLPLRAVEHFGEGIQLLNGYGLTETTSAVVTNVGVEFLAHPDSVGRPNLTADVRIVGPDGTPRGPGEVGEICVRSPQVAKGYWNDPDATSAAFVDGWFHSGDLGHLSEEGYLHVVDRLKDVVIRGGENVYCAEVEAAIYQHDAVAEAIVFGVPDERLGEDVAAAVVLRPGATLTEDDLRAHLAPIIAKHKIPGTVWFLDEQLPRNASGKFLKREVRDRLVTSD